jgi:hypothetical protein
METRAKRDHDLINVSSVLLFSSTLDVFAARIRLSAPQEKGLGFL